MLISNLSKLDSHRQAFPPKSDIGGQGKEPPLIILDWGAINSEKNSPFIRFLYQ